MSVPYWKPAEPVNDDQAHPGGTPVNENHALPVGLYLNEPGSGLNEVVGDARPLPVVVREWLNTVSIPPARRVISVGFNAAAAGDYTAGDIMSNSVTDTNGVALAVQGVVDLPGQVAILDKVVARCSEDSVLNRLRLHFYRSQPLPADVEMDDNIAADFAKTAIGNGNYVGPVMLSAFADGGTAMAWSTTPNLREMLKTSAISGTLWIVVETADAEVNETAGMRIDLDLYFLN